MAGLVLALFAAVPALAEAPAKQPNIIMIMGDDIGPSGLPRGLQRSGRP